MNSTTNQQINQEGKNVFPSLADFVVITQSKVFIALHVFMNHCILVCLLVLIVFLVTCVESGLSSPLSPVVFTLQCCVISAAALKSMMCSCWLSVVKHTF